MSFLEHFLEHLVIKITKMHNVLKFETCKYTLLGLLPLTFFFAMPFPPLRSHGQEGVSVIYTKKVVAEELVIHGVTLYITIKKCVHSCPYFLTTDKMFFSDD